MVGNPFRFYIDTRNLANAAAQQAIAAKSAADAAHESMIAAQLAWVGPNNAIIDGGLTAGAEVKFVVNYNNTGRQPAMNLRSYAESFVAADNDVNANLRIIRFSRDCMAKQLTQGGQVAFPTSGFTGYQMRSTLDKTKIDDDVVGGATEIILVGCFVYETFGSPHHSSFCFVYKKDFSQFPNLDFCDPGNEAD